MRTAKELDTCSGRLPGDVEDDMLGRIDRQKRGTAGGLGAPAQLRHLI
jgi:hypothetical protein